ncbi:MAG TPA: hypothetical protein VJ917_10400 [Saprospiraceae bacterium]|nr:hypothetical protein [Saprospiraceae bacterium]
MRYVLYIIFGLAILIVPYLLYVSVLVIIDLVKYEPIYETPPYCGIQHDTIIVEKIKKYKGVKKGIYLNNGCYLFCSIPNFVKTSEQINDYAYYYFKDDFLSIGDTLVFSKPRESRSGRHIYKTVDSVKVLNGNSKIKVYYSPWYIRGL